MSVKEFKKLSRQNNYLSYNINDHFFTNADFTGPALLIKRNGKVVAILPTNKQASHRPQAQFTNDPKPSRAETNLIVEFIKDLYKK